jgi:hypothetical protein
MRPWIAISAFAIALAACTTTGAQPADTVADGSSFTLAAGLSDSLAVYSRFDYV